MEQAPRTALELQRITIHGHERAYVKMGQGPALLLLHGLGCDTPPGPRSSTSSPATSR